MGVIWEKPGKENVPTLEDFEKIVAQLRTELNESPAIMAALLCGSVLRGDHTIRSDIDCVVIYDVNQEAAAYSLMNKLTSDGKDLNIPLNFVPCDSDSAQGGIHNLGPSFIEHLEIASDMGGIIKGDVFSLLAETVPLKDDVVSYLRTKLYNMQESYSGISGFSDERKVSFFKKTLEAPMHTARKTLIYFNALNLEDGDSKQNVRKAYHDFMPPEFAERFEELLQLDEWYTQEVEQQLVKPNSAEYLKCLERIESSIPNVIEFIRWNALYIHSRKGEVVESPINPQSLARKTTSKQ